MNDLNGIPGQIAVAGESAGANLAANVAIMARDVRIMLPLRQLLVYPVAGNDMDTPSYLENAMAAPLGKAAMTDRPELPLLQPYVFDDIAGAFPAPDLAIIAHTVKQKVKMDGKSHDLHAEPARSGGCSHAARLSDRRRADV
jgi:acetyl esterase/lipase